ncbi:MAG: Methyltransferase type 11 [Flavipsychrobacter sp.]|jgi:SAM-dependent methyltransferase|nr:Methyltransferase type 11 [Flavipsychrobacter sp.]
MNDIETNRAGNIQRMAYPKTSLNDPYYLLSNFLFRDLKHVIEKYGKGDVLDIGCGNKPYKCFFQNISRYTGCDIVQSSEGLVDIICQAVDIPLSDNSVDTIFTTQVIEHVADHRKLLSEAYRILKPGGYLILSGPMAWEHHEVPYDFFRFTRHGFEWLLEQYKFTEVQIIPNGGKWALVGQLMMNSIRSSFAKKTIIRRIFAALFFVLRIKWLINILFSALDKFDKDYSSTLNFVVVARKV